MNEDKQDDLTKTILIILTILFATLLLPILLLCTKESFTIISFLNYLKGISFPIFILAFSINRLKYNNIVSNYEHIREEKINGDDNPQQIKLKLERNEQFRKDEIELNRAKRSIKNLDKGLTYLGITFGAIGIISYLVAIFIKGSIS